MIMKRRIEQLDGPVRFADRVGVMLGFMGLAVGGAMAATLFGAWVVIGGVFASLIGVMVWLVAMLCQSDQCEVISEQEGGQVRGFSDCPECGQGRWYEVDRDEVCGECVARMMLAEGFDVEGGAR